MSIKQKTYKYFFFNKNLKQIFIKNMSWLLVSELSVRFLKFLLIPYSIHILGASQFGSFYYLLSLSSIFYLFSDLGLSGNLCREYNENQTDENNSSSLSIFFYTKTLAIILCFAISFIQLGGTNEVNSLKLLLIVLFFTFVENYKKIYISILDASKKSEIYSSIRIINGLLLVILGFIVLKTTHSLFYFVLVYLVTNLIELGLLLLFFKDKIPKLNKFNFNKSLKMIKTSFPFMLTGIIGLVLSLSDTLIIEQFLGVKMVAYYQAPLKLIASINVIHISIGKVIYPIMCELSHKIDIFSSFTKKCLSISIILALPIVAGGILLSNDIIILLFTDAFHLSINVLRIFMCTLFVSFLLAVINVALLSIKQEITNTKISFLSACINIVLSILLIFNYGIIGVAFATLVSRIVDCIFSINRLNTVIQTQIVDIYVIVKAGTSCVIMVILNLFLYEITPNLPILIMSGVISYIISIILLKERNTLELISILRKTGLFNKKRKNV
jgi:O-antigen/teichoic acid export membrane protein